MVSVMWCPTGLLASVIALGGLAAPTAGALTQFSTPSKNVGCIGDATSLRCDIAQTSVRPPARPASCQFDFGNYFSMSSRSRSTRACVSDTALGGRRIVAYGTSIRIGPFLCVSKTTGLRCTNRTGHGWSLSRAKITLF